MTDPQRDENSTEPFPVCGHPENVHAHWRADATCNGWAHCKVGSQATGDACQCWRDGRSKSSRTARNCLIEFVALALRVS